MICAANHPSISIIIPVRDRVAQLCKLLESIAASILPQGASLQTIVIDDSGSETGARIQALCLQFGAEYIRGPGSVAAKRNLGAEAAAAELLFFTDSDCVVDEQCLAAHITAHRANPTCGTIAGLIKLSGEQTPVGRIIERVPGFTAAFSFASWEGELSWAPTANLTVKRQAFKFIKGFSTEPGISLYGEDVDLGIRLTDAGWRIARLPTAIVFHSRDTTNSLRNSAKKAFKTGIADCHLQTLHPDRTTIRLPDLLLLAIPLLGLLAISVSNAHLLGLLVIWFCGQELVSKVVMLTLGFKGIKSVGMQLLILTTLSLAHKSGRFLTAVTNRKVLPLIHSFIYHPGQLLANRNREIAEAWGLLLFTLAVILWSQRS